MQTLRRMADAPDESKIKIYFSRGAFVITASSLAGFLGAFGAARQIWPLAQASQRATVASVASSDKQLEQKIDSLTKLVTKVHETQTTQAKVLRVLVCKTLPQSLHCQNGRVVADDLITPLEVP